MSPFALFRGSRVTVGVGIGGVVTGGAEMLMLMEMLGAGVEVTVRIAVDVVPPAVGSVAAKDGEAVEDGPGLGSSLGVGLGKVVLVADGIGWMQQGTLWPLDPPSGVSVHAVSTTAASV